LISSRGEKTIFRPAREGGRLVRDPKYPASGS
jgi:hypothetical protein